VSMLDDFTAAGGEGIEVISGLQIPSVTRDLALLCRKNNLLASCGSDFHSTGQPWASLGMVAQLPENLTPVWSRWV
jgi:predicted metal-dependent phosphoesterase TrpH